MFIIPVTLTCYTIILSCYNTIIPQEPMYIVLNTAISHRWGMPEPCPVDQCSMCWHCYDCTNPGETSNNLSIHPSIHPHACHIYHLSSVTVPAYTGPQQTANAPYQRVWRDARTYLLRWRSITLGEWPWMGYNQVPLCPMSVLPMPLVHHPHCRLYQDASDSSHTMGCSTELFPTDAFIRGHPGMMTKDNWCFL